MTYRESGRYTRLVTRPFPRLIFIFSPTKSSKQHTHNTTLHKWEKKGKASDVQVSTAPTTLIYRPSFEPVTRGTPTAPPGCTSDVGATHGTLPGPVTRGMRRHTPFGPMPCPSAASPSTHESRPPRHTPTCGVSCPNGASLSLQPPTTSASPITCGTGARPPRPDHPRHYTACSF
ncbi:hypothetical protein PIB30_040757 [Stylosanthes scabra]|uniref:Uncharacterized protein n=1 Tax=Stylosanthes scabra TaxID=79078 RepID=A0ABU6XEU6_9FABA|nr:hypothetical protein [Stylosanthes scabra]